MRTGSLRCRSLEASFLVRNHPVGFQYPALSRLSPARHQCLKTAGLFRVGRRDEPAISHLSRVTPFAGNHGNGSFLPLTGGYIGWMPLAGHGWDGRLAVSTLIFFNNLLSCVPPSEVASLGRDTDRCIERTFLSQDGPAQGSKRCTSQSALGTARWQHCSIVGRYELSRRANRDAPTSSGSREW